MDNATNYFYSEDISALVPEIPGDSILSRTFIRDERLKGIVFGFAPGQELSEHTASVPAILHFLQGEAELTLGEDTQQAKAGTWVYMPPKLPHSIVARTPLIMLLVMLET